MRRTIQVLALVPLLLSASVFAQSKDTTSWHRKRYDEIQALLGKAKVVKKVLKGDPYDTELKGWVLDGNILRIEATSPGEDGNGVEEYYFADGKLFFVFRVLNLLGSTGNMRRSEYRFYFSDGRMIRYIDDTKRTVSPRDSSFVTEQDVLLANAAKYLKAIEPRR